MDFSLSFSLVRFYRFSIVWSWAGALVYVIHVVTFATAVRIFMENFYGVYYAYDRQCQHFRVNVVFRLCC